jgi:glycosyltransferase involved in cell wall biosynthesis
MKILWVKAGKLLPVDTGGKIRSYNILRHLARKHEVTLLSYYGGPPDPDYDRSIGEHLPGAQTMHTAAPEGGLSQRLHYIRHLPSGAPYAVQKFTHPAVRQRVNQWLHENRFDVSVCDFLSASLNFPHRFSSPRVLFQHNVETVLWRRMAQTEKSPLLKLSYTLEANKMARYEKNALRRFPRIIAVSQQDRDEMLKLDSASQITVVPTGVDTAQYQVAPPAAASPPTIVFVGSMDWEPNIDAMEYFCHQIWPAVLASYPDARFQIVGRNPHPRVQALQSSSVAVTGTVSSVPDFLRPATVVIVPLRIGGGTRLKIFEAMAMGKAVVSTTIGAEGLDVTPDRDLILADDPECFAASILALIRDSGLRRNYEQAAAVLAAGYDWSEITASFAEVLREVAASFSVG